MFAAINFKLYYFADFLVWKNDGFLGRQRQEDRVSVIPVLFPFTHHNKLICENIYIQFRMQYLHHVITICTHKPTIVVCVYVYYICSHPTSSDFQFYNKLLFACWTPYKIVLRHFKSLQKIAPCIYICTIIPHHPIALYSIDKSLYKCRLK